MYRKVHYDVVKTSLLSLALSLLAIAAQAQAPSGAGAAAGMTPEQAAAFLQQNPQMGAMLRAQLGSSGLSQDEIRARLQAQGFPSTILDQYFATGDESEGLPIPTQQTIAAARALGLADFARQDSLLLSGDSVAFQLMRDSLRLDSIFREELRDRAIPRLRVFGLDVFRRPSTEFRSLAAGPVDQNYRLGPGDGLVLVLSGEIETAYQIDVTHEGSIFIPDVGQVFVNNLTLAQLRELLYTRLGRVYSGISRRPNSRTRFDISVNRVRAVSVRVMGEVGRPGTYQVGAAGGVLSALYEAGGANERGSLRSVKVLRGADSVGTVDIYGYLLSGITPTELLVDAGDVVYVPLRGTQVKIAGEVVRPAIYEMKPGEGLRELVRIAGGLTPQAAATNVTIARTLPLAQRTAPGRERTVVTVDLATILDPAASPIQLFPDDSVTIPPVRGGMTSSVKIAGSVWQPNTYRLEPGMRLWDLIRMAGGLRPETYAGRAQIVRSLPDSSRVMMGVVLDSLAPGNNPPLSELDIITIYPRTDFRPERYVGIYGSVRKPGIVVFSDSMTLRDAVLLAGGTTEDAYLAQAEVSRVRMDGTQGDSIAVALKVPLDSSFVIDPSGFKRPVGSSGAPQVLLQPYDNVYIRRQPGLEAQRTVVLGGEVQFPGRYTLVSKTERITDLIQRAGGLTSRAYANGIRFFRRAYTHPRGVGLETPSESAELGLIPRENTAMTRVGVDLERVLRDADHKDNLALLMGDSIHIPTFIPVVLVEGGVNAPSSVTYVPGAGRDYYINAAGGYARLADKGGTFVQQPNGIIEKKGKPGPGAVVVVPLRESPPPSQFVIVLPAILGLIGSLATAATTVIVVALTRN